MKLTQDTVTRAIAAGWKAHGRRIHSHYFKTELFRHPDGYELTFEREGERLTHRGAAHLTQRQPARA